MIAILIYLSTIIYIPHQVILLPVFLLIIKNRNKNIVFNKHQVYTFILLSLIIFLSFINSLLHFDKLESIFNLIPYISLMFASFIIAYFIEIKDIEILVKLIFIECLIVILEYIIGINTVFYFSDIFEKFNSYSLFYNTRPFGLSSNSSNVAEKILLAILLIDYFDLFIKNKKMYLFIFGISIILTFPRTVIVAFIIYYLIKFINSIKISSKIRKRLLLSITVISVLLILAVFIGFNKYKDKIENQFTRGTNKIELAGRPIIWNKYYEFIKDHIYFGNNSQKYGIKYFEQKDLMHAHNSFIQVLANHGIIIASLFLLLILVNLTKKNYIYISILVLFSLAQYGIFWGISLADIVLFILLISKNTCLNDTFKLQINEREV